MTKDKRTDVIITKENDGYSVKFLMSGNEYGKDTLKEIFMLIQDLTGTSNFTYTLS